MRAVMTSEIYRKTKMCSNCPFLKSENAIQLNDGRLDEIKKDLLGGASFNCHKTVYNLDDKMRSTDEQKLKMCKGAYNFLKSKKRPNQQMQTAKRLGIKEL